MEYAYISHRWLFFLVLVLFIGELEIKPITNPFNHGFNQACGKTTGGGVGRGGGVADA